MRLLLITGMLLAFLSCKKDHTPENGLPLDQIHGKILYTGLEAIGSDGNHYRPLVTEGTTPHWSADGKLLMYSLKKDPSLGTGGQEIRVRNLETGEERLLVAHATFMSWYPVV